MNGQERMLAACRCQEVDRPPLWLMRQAGRYLPEYLELREHHGFWEILRSPELALEVALQPLRRFQLDAAILFSDILVPLDAMGAEVNYADKGPLIGKLFRDRADLDRIRQADIGRDLAYVGEAMSRLCTAVQPDHAVIGFAGAPLTLATYLVEGSHRGELRQLKQLLYIDPELGRDLLDALADAAVELLLMQIEAGADMVQIFDSWSGYLAPEDYAELALPSVTRMVRRIQATGTPVALYFRSSASHLEAVASTGCEVLAVDASVTMTQARSRAGSAVCLQGNLDPAELLAPPERIRRRVHDLISGAGPTGLIVNVGQGLFPGVPIEGVAAFVDAVVETQAE